MHFARLLGTAALSLFACLAQAVPVTFNFSSTVTLGNPFGGGVVDPAFAVGTTLDISVTFDSAAAFVTTRLDSDGNPTVFDFDPGSISMTISGGGVTRTNAFEPGGSGLIRIRDSAQNPDCGSGNPFTSLCTLVDGISFLLISPDALTSWSLILRGTTLDLITGAVLPTSQDSRWDNQEIAVLSICSVATADAPTCDAGELSATVSAVPEPSTLALAALGVVAAVRRRRAASPR